MACCIKVCCVGCLGITYGIAFGFAWASSPNFRKKMREKWASDAREDEEFDRRLEEMEASLSSLGEMIENAQARRDALGTKI
jgi:hypothetical protein